MTPIAKIPYRSERLKFGITALFIFVFFSLAFRIGLVRGLQDTIADPTWGRVQFAIGSAITSMKHGGYGYSIAGPVKTILEYAGLTGDAVVLKNIGMTFPDNLRDPNTINKAIKKAIEFKAPISRDENVSGIGGDDIGMVDFVRVSFLLFGFNLLSFYLTFFAILGVSLVCACIAFRQYLGAQVVFVVLALALPLIFSSSLLNTENDGILDPRFLSTLGIVPLTHIALATLGRTQRTASDVALIAIQSAIVVFTCWIRSSALWMVLTLLVLAAALTGRSLSTARRMDLQRLWPVGLLCLLAVAHLTYVAAALHPVYRSADERPYHGVWHAMVYGLQLHPEWKDRYAAQFGNATFDEQPDAIAKNYLMRHPPTDPDAVYLTPDRKYIRNGVTERYKRKAWFEFVESDPAFVLGTYFVHNPRRIYEALSYHFASILGVPRIYKLAAALALVAIAVAVMLDSEDLRQLRNGNLFLTASFIVSLSYLVLAPSRQVVADQLFLLLAMLAGWMVLAVAHAAKRIALKAPQAGPTGE